MFIHKRFLLTMEEISAFATVHNVLNEICENSQCESCVLKEYCHASFDPTATIEQIKFAIANGK